MTDAATMILTVLFMLEEGSLGFNEMLSRLDCDEETLLPVLKELEQRGWVECFGHGYQSGHLFTLTEAGRKALKESAIDPKDKPFTKGHQYAPPGDPLTLIACGPSTGTCKCECATGGPCEHVWDGPEKTDGNLSTATCSRCGMPAIEHDMWVMP